MATGAVWDEKYMWWDTRSAGAFIPAGGWIEPDEHVENPRTKRRLKNLLDASGLSGNLNWLPARPATVEQVCRVHDRDYVQRMQELSDGSGGDAGELVPFGPGGFEIAMLAAGGAIVAAEAVQTRVVNNAYALIRPPGHHAERNRGRGFCMFGNVAIAVRHLQAIHAVGRIAVVDWDVHHGNGTQQAFYGSADVLTISLHQDRYYPQNSGAADEAGEGAGVGANLNIPLPPGTGPGGYLYAFETVVLPALRRFRPEFVIVASGLDSGALDPLGRQMLHSDAYRRMTRLVGEVAAECAGGRLLVVHEGGYSTAYVPFCGLAVIEQLSGIRTEVQDPYLDFLAGIGGMDLQPHQQVIVDALRPLVDLVPGA